MTIKQLIKDLKDLKKRFPEYPDIEEYEVYLELLTPADYKYKIQNDKKYIIKGQDGDFDFMKACDDGGTAWITIMPKEKAIGIQINY